MRLITIILSLFLTHTSYTFCKEYNRVPDTLKKHPAKKHLSKKEIERLMAEENKNYKPYFDDCTFVNKYTAKQRLIAYPYSNTTKIVAVSYPCYCAVPHAEIIIDKPDGQQDTIDKATKDTILRTGLIVNNGVLDPSSIKEMKILTPAQINRLTNIIYNTRLKVYQNRHLVPALFENGGGGCFNPRNALLFIDKNGKIFDYLEVCFECTVADSKSGKISLGSGCNQKFDLLKKYFIEIGIKYGTINKN
jgi:hypothetical protein